MRIQEILSSTPRSSLVRFPGPTSPQVNAKTKLLRVMSDEDGAPNFRMPRRRWLLFRGWWEAPGRTRPPSVGEHEGWSGYGGTRVYLSLFKVVDREKNGLGRTSVRPVSLVRSQSTENPPEDSPQTRNRRSSSEQNHE